ncbi:hypothetical protein [Motilibacter aurantiacus]|uniref:hypothetical protein n=1 Tax=Motilibacter aurantiacus TaxID=2714955 RepID=UPI00140A8CD7|nr:hypothetical protein [Motilibacter aurantiacus]NHC47385.1 hypothetical protein [Motilibacter aurantiacus]
MTTERRPGHLGLNDLADLDAGLLEAEQAAYASSHLAGCATCRQRQEQLAAVDTGLHALGAEVEMPPGVAARLDAALAAEAAGPLAGEEPAAVPLQARGRHRAAGRTGTARPGRPRPSRQRVGALAAAAGVAAVAVLALGTVLSPGGGGSDDAGSAVAPQTQAQLKADQEARATGPAGTLAAPGAPSAAAGTAPDGPRDSAGGGEDVAAAVPGPAPLGRTTVSGAAYTEQRVRRLAPQLAAGTLPEAALRRAPSAECVAMLTAGNAVVAVDEGTWQGRPALLVVTRSSGGLAGTVVAAPCTPSAVRTPLLSVPIDQ